MRGRSIREGRPRHSRRRELARRNVPLRGRHRSPAHLHSSLLVGAGQHVERNGRDLGRSFPAAGRDLAATPASLGARVRGSDRRGLSDREERIEYRVARRIRRRPDAVNAQRADTRGIRGVSRRPITRTIASSTASA